ncbi:hypothetical protein G9C98_006023 [Cotesia typhae]|uniref:Peroxiredoxin-5 n=1 Tax=Cotesia typhae TaxID=2053667 RepID=A0A8J5QWS4_9HYME|nr:hypothetical protein G9C98_006023 [Cotesia typhae]
MTQYISRAIVVVGRSSLSCVKRGFHVSPRAMVISVGDKLPSVDLYEDAPSNKTHLPGYVTKADELKSKGVHEIACVSVNDPFVMSAWGKDQGASGKVRMLADTNAEFTKALDVAMDLAVLGGTRSKRYSLVVEDGIVKEVNIEPDNTGLSCSLADRIKV